MDQRKTGSYRDSQEPQAVGATPQGVASEARINTGDGEGMAGHSEPIADVTPQDPPSGDVRVRKVDWAKVLVTLDSNPGVWHLIGEFNQSIRTHINQGRYRNVDPALYLAKTGKADSSRRTRANLFMQRLP
jgi:hypothetical protein